jgi:hypothetical protein
MGNHFHLLVRMLPDRDFSEKDHLLSTDCEII